MTNHNLCDGCRHSRRITSANGARYVLCELSLTDRRFPKYPPQPLVDCQGFVDAQSLEFEIISGMLSVCRLPPGSATPGWLRDGGQFVSISHSPDETSIVCPQADLPQPLPEGLQCQRDFRGLRITGQLDFEMIGIIAQITQLFAQAKISVFVVSTFNTDYFLVSDSSFNRAVEMLSNNGHRINGLT